MNSLELLSDNGDSLVREHLECAFEPNGVGNIPASGKLERELELVPKNYLALMGSMAGEECTRDPRPWSFEVELELKRKWNSLIRLIKYAEVRAHAFTAWTETLQMCSWKNKVRPNLKTVIQLIRPQSKGVARVAKQFAWEHDCELIQLGVTHPLSLVARANPMIGLKLWRQNRQEIQTKLQKKDSLSTELPYATAIVPNGRLLRRGLRRFPDTLVVCSRIPSTQSWWNLGKGIEYQLLRGGKPHVFVVPKNGEDFSLPKTATIFLDDKEKSAALLAKADEILPAEMGFRLVFCCGTSAALRKNGGSGEMRVRERDIQEVIHGHRQVHVSYGQEQRSRAVKAVDEVEETLLVIGLRKKTPIWKSGELARINDRSINPLLGVRLS